MIGRAVALVALVANCLYPLWAVPALPPIGRAVFGVALSFAAVLVGVLLERRIPDPAPERVQLPRGLAVALAAAGLLLLVPASWPLLTSSDEQYHAFVAVPAWEAVERIGGGAGRYAAFSLLAAAAGGIGWALRRPWPRWAWAVLFAAGALPSLAGASAGALVSERATEHIFRFPALAKPVYLGAYLLIGPSEIAARLPSVAGHLLSAVFLHRLLVLGGAARAAAPAAALLLFAPAPFRFAHLAFLDTASLAFSLAALAAYAGHLDRPSRAGLPLVAAIAGAGFLYRQTALLALLVVGLCEAVRALRARRLPEGAVEALLASALLVAPFYALHVAVVGRGHALEAANALRPVRLLFQGTQVLWTAGLGAALAPVGLIAARRSPGLLLLALWGAANYAMMATAAQWAEPRLVLPFVAACVALAASAAAAFRPAPRAALAALFALEAAALAYPVGRGGEFSLTAGRWPLRFPYREAMEGIRRHEGPTPSVYHPAIATPRHFYAAAAGVSLDRWAWEPFAPPAAQTADGLYAHCRAKGFATVLLPNRIEGIPGEFQGYEETLNGGLVRGLLAGDDPRFRVIGRWSYGPNDLVLLKVEESG